MNRKDAIGVLADFLETYRKTVALTGRAEHVEMPAETKARRRSLLLEELRRGRS